MRHSDITNAKTRRSVAVEGWGNAVEQRQLRAIYVAHIAPEEFFRFSTGETLPEQRVTFLVLHFIELSDLSLGIKARMGHYVFRRKTLSNFESFHHSS